MKNIIVISLLLLGFIITASGQGSYWTTSTGGKTNPSSVSANQISTGNTWFGAGASYALAGEEGFKDNFLFNTQILYNISLDSSRINLPIGGKLSFPVNGGNVQDISIGIYPYKIVYLHNKGLTVVAHGGLEYNVDPRLDSEDTNLTSSQRVRVFLGSDISIPTPKFKLPIVLSVTPILSLTNSDNAKVFGALETALIYPISNSLGVFTEHTMNFCSDEKSTYVIGVINNIRTN